MSVVVENGLFRIRTPYNGTFVAELKARIPAGGRRYDPTDKSWTVSPTHGAVLALLLETHYGYSQPLPAIAGAAAQRMTFRADYVANSKADTGWSAIWSDGGWNASVAETELRRWFRQPAGHTTLFSILGLDESAVTEDIRKAYKRGARQWHPDVCREPNAREMFEQIKHAYETLADPDSRRRYVAGLAFERLAGVAGRGTGRTSFMPLLRCGILTVIAKQEAGGLIIEEILDWQDITNAEGKTLVASWGGKEPIQSWI